MVPSLSSSPPPTNLGRYELVCPLGEGGMARVYLALQRGPFDATRVVVVKHIRPEYAADEEFLAMFVDEARIAVRLSHANVVHTYEVVAEAPDYCLVMEYLEGQTLTQVLKRAGRERLDRDDHIWVLSQVLAGLSYAHELKDFDGAPLGIVHRDVTPSNVLITSTGEVKLLDFGIAKAAGAVSLTQQGVIKGKIGYAAPEQCLAEAVDQRADVYSVGVMLWEAIAGRRRTTGTTPLAAFRTRIESGEPPIESVVPDVEPRLAEVCQRALARDPAQRYATSRELQQALEDYLVSRGRTARAEALGAIVRGSCGEELAQRRRALEGHAVSRQAAGFGSYQRSPGSVSSMRAISEAHSHRPTSNTVDPFAEERQRKRRGVVIAAVSALGLGVLGLVALRPNAPVAASAAPPAALPPAPAAQSPVLAAAPRMRLIVAATPGKAQIKVDGQVVDNPYVADLPADGSKHQLSVSADGYAPIERALVLAHDLELKLALTRDAGSKHAAVEAEPATAAPAERAPAAAPTPAKPSTPAASPRAAAAIEPGVDLRGAIGVRAGRKIDNKDPYSQ
jgi:serine/threonine protein kinase